MKSYFQTAIIVLLTACSSILCSETELETCFWKLKGVETQVQKVPTTCCQNGKITKKSLAIRYGSQNCAETICPLLEKLKGCKFMCHFSVCNQNYGGQDKCKQKCQCRKKPFFDCSSHPWIQFPSCVILWKLWCNSCPHTDMCTKFGTSTVSPKPKHENSTE